jgi:hypothetical protein
MLWLAFWVVHGLFAIGVVLAGVWAIRRGRTRRTVREVVGGLWELVTHKTHPGDITGQYGRDPNALWPEHEKKVHTHAEIMAAYSRRHPRRPASS